MIMPDVNVLIGAFRRDSSHHSICKPWLDAVVLNSEPFGLSPIALAAVVRITTASRFLSQPSTHELAFAFCNSLLGQPQCIVIEPGDRHWSIFEALCKQTGIVGGKVTDVWYAALAIEHGCTWISLDRDFAKFPGLDWRKPN